MGGWDRFVAIDWSGAKTVTGGAIAIGACIPGEGAPELVAQDRPWSRSDVLALLREAAAARHSWLIGMDFSFAPPFIDRNAYFASGSTPSEARALWAYVNYHSHDADLGATDFVTGLHTGDFYQGAASGPKAKFQRWRACEATFNAAGGGKASSVFDCVGASQVAKASFSGMRLLHHLGDAMPVWPFDPLPLEGPVLVEIYCRMFLQRALGKGQKVRNVDKLNTGLARLHSAPWAGNGWLSDHQTDVLMSAAGLRDIAHEPRWWQPNGLERVAQTEGWTFGVA